MEFRAIHFVGLGLVLIFVFATSICLAVVWHRAILAQTDLRKAHARFSLKILLRYASRACIIFLICAPSFLGLGVLLTNIQFTISNWMMSNGFDTLYFLVIVPLLFPEGTGLYLQFGMTVFGVSLPAAATGLTTSLWKTIKYGLRRSLGVLVAIAFSILVFHLVSRVIFYSEFWQGIQPHDPLYYALLGVEVVLSAFVYVVGIAILTLLYLDFETENGSVSLTRRDRQNL